MEETKSFTRPDFLKSNHQLKFIADSVSIHLNYLDKNLRFVFVNKAAADFWHLIPEVMIGKTIRQLAGDEKYFDIEPCIEKVLAGENTTHEITIIKEDGSTRYFNNNYIPDFNSEGEVIGFVICGTDITDSRLAYQKTEKMASEFRILADSMPQIVWTANPDGQVDYYNKSWYEFTGLPFESTDNALWDGIIHRDDLIALNSTWENSVNSGAPYELEFRVKNFKSGKYHWHLSRARPVLNSAGKIVKWYGSSTDINEQKNILHKLETEQKLRDHIISALSHDLRTPIAAAKISSQLLVRKTSDAVIHKLAFRIEDNMDRADKMIQDLLDASMVKAGNSIPVHVKECDIHRVLNTVIEEFSLIHGNRFRYEGPEELVGEWDCDGIRRIFENLISNAIKYGDPVRKIYVKASTDYKTAVLKVINYGSVIAEDDITTLFHPFKRMNNLEHIKGWGIGLSLVKGLTEAHGGQVSVSSSKEEGTIFTITLPLRR